MPTPLEDIRAPLDLLRETARVARFCVGAPGESAQSALANTSLVGMSLSEADTVLEKAETALKDLAILSLFARFEQLIRDRLKGFSGHLAACGPPPEIGKALVELFERHFSDRPIASFWGLFSPPATDDHRSQIGMVRKYRNSVAHGTDPEPEVRHIDLDDAQQYLEDFLRAATLI